MKLAVRTLVLITLAGLSAPARATTVKAISVRELATQADSIVIGVALKGEGYWDGGRIMTRVPVKIDEVLLGRNIAETVVTVTTFGGVIGALGQWVDGAARLYPAERVALFLSHNQRGEIVPVAMAQGVFHIERGMSDAVRIFRHVEGARVLGPRPEVEPSTLAELKAMVKEAQGGRP
jgi:hypothetical protein